MLVVAEAYLGSCSPSTDPGINDFLFGFQPTRMASRSTSMALVLHRALHQNYDLPHSGISRGALNAAEMFMGRTLEAIPCMPVGPCRGVGAA